MPACRCYTGDMRMSDASEDGTANSPHESPKYHIKSPLEPLIWRKVMKKIKKGDIVKWRGIKNFDTGEIEYGYLFFATTEGGKTRTGYRVKGKNRTEAIKNWRIAHTH